MKTFLIKKAAVFAIKNWKPILGVGLAVIALIIYGAYSLITSAAGALAPFMFGGNNQLPGIYQNAEIETGVDWSDMAAYDAIRTKAKFTDVNIHSITQTASRFIYYVEVCTGNGDDVVCIEEPRYYTLEEVMIREGFSESDIDYALFIRENLPEFLGDTSGDLVEIDPEIIANNKFIWPVPTIHRISDVFGIRIHPITEVRKMHNGVDLSNGATGAPIVASSDGIVYQVRKNTDSCGIWVRLKHDDGFSTKYCHMKRVVVVPITDGDPTRVKKGDIIGYVGETGGVTGPHLHFEIAVNGTPIDPLPLIMRSRPGGDDS